jgi:hypothetical protein
MESFSVGKRRSKTLYDARTKVARLMNDRKEVLLGRGRKLLGLLGIIREAPQAMFYQGASHLLGDFKSLRYVLDRLG